MTRPRAVFDASLLLRAGLARSEDAREWTARAATRELDALVPELIWAEVTNVLSHQVRTGVIEGGLAAQVLDRLVALPVETKPLQPLAPGALAMAMRHGLSGYDAFYLVLAQAASAILVTADRRLAATAAQSELVG